MMSGAFVQYLSNVEVAIEGYPTDGHPGMYIEAYLSMF